MSARQKQTIPNVDPDFLEKQKAVVCDTLSARCNRRFKVTSKSAMLRQAVIERVLADMDENHPTLF